jgi:ribosomal protein L32
MQGAWAPSITLHFSKILSIAKIMTLRSLPFIIPLQMASRMVLPSEALSVGRRWHRVLQTSPGCFHTLLKPAALSLNVPGLLSDVWDSVLRAVPKKKTSHMKKRHRQMAGKALKDVKNLNTCSGCGQLKRAHVLCPHCVESM